jgi:hypothetical protein
MKSIDQIYVYQCEDRELLDELIRRNADKLRSDPCWTGHEKLRNLLFDAGKLIAEWDGRKSQN